MAQYDVSVTVTDNATGDAIENASVDFGTASATTGTDGTATLTVEEGERAVVIDHADYETVETTEVVDQDNTTFNYGLDETYAVTVTVTDSADGSAIENATVDFGGTTGTTDVDGIASFELPADTYSVLVDHDDYYESNTEATVDETNTDFSYALDAIPEYSVTVTVEDEHYEEPVENVDVTFSQGGTTEAALTTDVDGVATATLKEGRYSVTIAHTDYETVDTRQTIDDTTTEPVYTVEQTSYPGENEDTHMLRFECSEPTTSPNPDQLFNSIDNWLDGFTEALPGQRNNVDIMETEDGTETIVRGSYRFTIGESKADIIDQLEQRLQNHVEWYEIRYHVCDHGHDDRGGCDWDDVIEWQATN